MQGLYHNLTKCKPLLTVEDQQRKDLISAELERFAGIIAPLYTEIDARIAFDLPEEFDETCGIANYV